MKCQFSCYLTKGLDKTHETPAFGGISLALRGIGAFGFHLTPSSAAVKE